MRRSTVYFMFMIALMVLFVLAQPSAATPLTRTDSPQMLQAKPAAPDTPDSAPMHPPTPLQPTAGETIITYEVTTNGKVKFKVNDGWDLDQYLFANSSPLDFYIDLQGFKPHPTDPTQVTLRVWDVDQNGAPGFPQCLVEVDKVYVNGAYLGDLTGADSQWSNVTFSIPAGVLNDGANHFWVDIDVLTGSCWAVTVDWAEIEIPFNIAQLEASALDDIAIKRDKTDIAITDPIWQTSFDAAGEIVTPANPDDPIADKIKGSWFFNWGAREFKYKYKIDTWPTGATPSWQPKVSYSWEIPGTGQSSGGFQDQNGWENEFKVTIPGTVGKYTLEVTLKIYHQDELLRTETRSHTLYAIYNTPVGSVASVSTGQPRTAWLDVATDWASGQNTEVNILNALNNSEYGGGSNPLGWEYGYPNVAPVTLIESGAGQNGDCYNFRDVWRILAASLGVSTGQDSYHYGNGFMTSTRSALDGNASANGRNQATGTRDRWVFGSHAFGTFGGTLYDPTFGLIGGGKEGNIFCKVSATTGLCDVLSPPPTFATLTYVAFPPANNGWGIMEYQTFTAPAPIPRAPETAVFTGSSSDSGYDMDGNGLFEHLRLNVELDVSTTDDYGILATLTDSAGNGIAIGSLDPDIFRSVPLTGATLNPGIQTIPIYFSGFSVRASVADGPYTANISLYDSAGLLLGSASFTTTTYSYQEFQGALIEFLSASDSGLDADGQPGYELLRVAVDINALAAGDAFIQGQLFAGGSYLADATAVASLSAGMQTINLDFPGEAIAASGTDGPYTVYLSFQDAYYATDAVHTTTPYSYTDFQLPAAFFTGNVADIGNDANGNGLYEELLVAVEVGAFVPDSYTVHGILQDGSGAFIGAAAVTALLDGVPQVVQLSFSGLAIYNHATDGPYQVLLSLTDAAGNDLMNFPYTTMPYAYTDFESPAASFNDIFADSGVDTDGDAFYNFLRIDIGVEVAVAGVYRVDGSLHDDSGAFIDGALTEAYLNAGAQTISLNFDGAAINAHGVDGPYNLRALTLAQVGVGYVDSLLDAYQTGPYAYPEFQPSALVLTGNFADYGEDLDGDGLYDNLVVTIELVVAQANLYYFNARLVDANGEEIVWAASSAYLTPGVQSILLRFNGRYIYGNGVDGPYDVKNLSIYTGSQSFAFIDVYTTNAYTWQSFEPAGVVRGTVTIDGLPTPNVNVFISGINSDLTDSNGAYRLTVVNSGNYVITIDAGPPYEPWQIWVNGEYITDGFNVTIPVSVGEVTEVNFVQVTTITVAIDILPKTPINRINPYSYKAVGVAILTTPAFDAATVDPLSVAFGPAGARTVKGHYIFYDIDFDGDLDLILAFFPIESGIQCGDTSASLIGQTFDGQTITGSDTIITIGCRGNVTELRNR